MPDLIHVFAQVIQDGATIEYLPRLYGVPRADGMWEGYLAFAEAALGRSL